MPTKQNALTAFNSLFYEFNCNFLLTHLLTFCQLNFDKKFPLAEKQQLQHNLMLAL